MNTARIIRIPTLLETISTKESKFIKPCKSPKYPRLLRIKSHLAEILLHFHFLQTLPHMTM